MALTLSAKGWVVTPAELRVEDPAKQGYGMLKGGASLTKALLKERAAERKREETKIKKRHG